MKLIIISGIVYDVSEEPNFRPEGLFNIYAGKDASRALGMLSRQPEDAVSDWSTLTNSEKNVLNNWINVFEYIQPIIECKSH